MSVERQEPMTATTRSGARWPAVRRSSSISLTLRTGGCARRNGRGKRTVRAAAPRTDGVGEILPRLRRHGVPRDAGDRSRARPRESRGRDGTTSVGVPRRHVRSACTTKPPNWCRTRSRIASARWAVTIRSSPTARTASARSSWSRARIPTLVETQVIIEKQFGPAHDRTRVATTRVVTLYERSGSTVAAAEWRAKLPKPAASTPAT